MPCPSRLATWIAQYYLAIELLGAWSSKPAQTNQAKSRHLRPKRPLREDMQTLAPDVPPETEDVIVARPLSFLEQSSSTEAATSVDCPNCHGKGSRFNGSEAFVRAHSLVEHGRGPEEAEGTVSKETGEASGEPVCYPDGALLRLVLPRHHKELFLRGNPQPRPALEQALPPGCAGEDLARSNCCAKKFWQQASNKWHDETMRMDSVADVYTNVVSQSFEPMVKKWQKQNFNGGDEALSIIKAKQDAVVHFINQCEKRIFSYLSGTTCKLCSPELKKHVVGDRYMVMDQQECDNIFQSCHTAPGALGQSAKGYDEAADALAEALADSSAVDADEASWWHDWMRRVAQQLHLAAERVDFYASKPQLCGKLGRTGYGYKPVEWANLDEFHPSQAQDPVATYDPTANNLDNREHRRRCKHGKQDKTGKCTCLPCWTGDVCDVPAETGPVVNQAFSPLTVRHPFMGQFPGQTLKVVGCRMPTDESAQLAQIKFIEQKLQFLDQNGQEVPESKVASVREMEAGVQVDVWRHRDTKQQVTQVEPPRPCESKAVATRLDMRSRVPTRAADKFIEFVVNTDKGDEGRYHVCYCFGTDCGEQQLNLWHKIGVLEVFRSKDQLNEAEGLTETEEENSRSPPLEPGGVSFLELGNEVVQKTAKVASTVGSASGFQGRALQSIAPVILGQESLEMFESWPLEFSADKKLAFEADRCWGSSLCGNGTAAPHARKIAARRDAPSGTAASAKPKNAEDLMAAPSFRTTYYLKYGFLAIFVIFIGSGLALSTKLKSCRCCCVHPGRRSRSVPALYPSQLPSLPPSRHLKRSKAAGQ